MMAGSVRVGWAAIGAVISSARSHALAADGPASPMATRRFMINALLPGGRVKRIARAQHRPSGIKTRFMLGEIPASAPDDDSSSHRWLRFSHRIRGGFVEPQYLWAINCPRTPEVAERPCCAPTAPRPAVTRRPDERSGEAMKRETLA